ncbi:hypothetical protein INT47_000952 [Mucor saturninus]|uniref:Calcium-channel protein CCH1 n=1 Tax=Mucor saturninus TaxID=64648 RepID=A0A8H7RR92_9FUNG|nr:hypothetical protein INT47_000952 [Mucor saturninus]
MSFAPKVKVNTSDIQRRYTQKKQPLSMDAFITEFEQERSPTPLIIEDSSMVSFDDENQDFSDTARLTVNASSVSGFHQNKVQQDDTSRPSSQQHRASHVYEPALIDPEVDQRTRKINKFIHFDKRAALKRTSRAIRRLSKRVINVHNNNSDSYIQPQQQAQPHTTALPQQNGPDSDTFPLIHQGIHNKPYHMSKPNHLLAHAASYYINPEKKDTKEYIHLSGYSLKLLSPTNPFRILLADILCWKWYETFMMLLLAFHGTTLFVVGWGTNSEPEPPNQWEGTWDQFSLLVIFSLYTLFMLCQIIVYGLFINPKHTKTAFLRHSWNRIDFVSIIAYWIDFGLLITQQEINEEAGRRLLVFKMLSALILLRLLNLTDGNRVILNSLKKAAPLLVNVLYFVLFFFVIFAIVGVQSFKGSFKRHCVWHDPANSTNTVELSQYCGGYIDEFGNTVPYKLKNNESAPWSKGFICENGLICQETENPFGGTISFDNIFESMLLVMIITGVQSWTDRMYDMMDAEYFIASLYFVIIVIVMNFWLVNLFIAVITEMFAKVREDSQHSAFTSSSIKPVLADDEEGWAFDAKREEALKLRKTTTLNLIVNFMKPFWLLLIAADLFCMAAKNNDMSDFELESLSMVELVLSLAFLFEILLRLLNDRNDLKGFFMNKMNSTDLIIAVITCIIQIPPIRKHTLVYIWFTGFQVLRIYRLVAAVPRLRSLMSRVLGSVHGLINLSFFIVLATIITAIIAYQLFEGVIPSDSGEEMRFFSIYNSFVGLYQLFSGEDWTTVLYNVMEAGSTNGNSAIYALFLVFWFAFSNFVLVNMFIAVLMENFEIAENDKRKNQILHYMKKTENEIDKKTVVSRWNIYRYFKAKPKELDVTNIPSNLVLSVQKNIVREFMNEADQQHEPVLVSSKSVDEPHGGLKRVQNFLSKLFPDSNNKVTDQPKFNNRTSLYLNPGTNALDQVGTFYDFKKRGGEINEPRSLRYLVDPTLRENVATRFQQEAADHDIDERRALKRDFILAHPSYDKSLYIFSSGNPIRRWCQLIVQPSRGERIFGTPPSRWGSIIFLTIITICVLANVVLTVYNSPVYQHEHRGNPAVLQRFINLDWAFTVIFTCEFLIKVIADGLLLTPNAYMLNGWNLLDVFVLISLYMSNFGRFTGATGLERGFRAFKALRALRLINLLGPAKETFTAILVTGLPRILDAAALGLCLIVPFALYGQNIFMGLFYNCNDGDEMTKFGCLNEGMLDMQEPQPDGATMYMPRIWANPYVYSFDSFWSSLLILFEIASGEGWVDVLATSMSVMGKDQATQQDASQLWGIFFMVYNLAGSVFVISLFLGVVIENFTRRNGTAYLTGDQRRWLDLKKLLNQIRPAKRPKVMPSNPFRKICFNLTVEKRGKFYKFMTFIISLNILFLCTDSANDLDGNEDNGAKGWSRVKVYIYLVFIGIYWLEIMVKLLGLGWKSFRRNLWNLFDLTMVIGSFITAIITLGNPNLQVNVESQKLFMTALCFKLVQRSDSLNQLFTTMAASAYQIVNVFAVWFVVLTTYAIMFMQIFGLTKYGPSAQTEHINFRSYSNTMISLVRYSTGEGWNAIMHDFTVEFPNCVVADDYLDSDCGSLRWSYFLFLTFNIISMYIFIAIFVAVVADNFSYVYQIKANFSLVNRDEIRKFKMIWASVDTERTGYISASQYMTLWRKLEGIFTVRIFEPEYSYKNLVKECSTNTVNEEAGHHLDMHALNEKLNQLDKREIHAKRHDLEKIYWETALVESTARGVSFNQMLLMLAQRKLIVPENSLILEELLENQKKDEAIHTLISIDRVRGLIETIALRKKFLKHLANIKKQPEVPAIVIDNTDVIVAQQQDDGTPISGHPDLRSYNGSSVVSSANVSSVYDHYLSSDEENEDDVDEEILQEGEEEDSIIEDIPSHDIWKEMLRNADK